MRRLVLALGDRAMGPEDVVALLGLAERAARNYLSELKEAGVGCSDPEQRGFLRLSGNSLLVQDFLDELAEQTMDPDEIQVRKEPRLRRDPLVSALFGHR